MFYLKAFLIISAVSALPLSQLDARQITSQLVPPELIPQTCSWQCGPTLAVPNNCASSSNSDCVCTASVANNLQYCINCFWTQSSQGDPTGSWMSTAVEWANAYNLQCREAGFDFLAVVAGGDELNAVTSDAPDNGSPAVPRVSPPSIDDPPAPVISSSVSTPTPTPTPTPSAPSSTPTSTSTSSTSTPSPAPTTSPAPTSAPAPTLSASGLDSTLVLGSQTITLAGSNVPLNIPGNNASDTSAAAAAAAAANAAHKSVADRWIPTIIGIVSVAAAVLF